MSFPQNVERCHCLPTARSDFKVNAGIMMTLSTRGGQAVDHPRLVSPRFLRVGDHGVMREGTHGSWLESGEAQMPEIAGQCSARPVPAQHMTYLTEAKDNLLR
ncbi:MAG: hypothetical protein P8P36_05305 [Akkermansiaceae bacterium]|nr:hypothetical protein [Akkermansiaceae bacterium]